MEDNILIQLLDAYERRFSPQAFRKSEEANLICRAIAKHRMKLYREAKNKL